jgi:hypothetical protein
MKEEFNLFGEKNIHRKSGLGGIARDDRHEYFATAAKVIVTDWKEVNGWDFWMYQI